MKVTTVLLGFAVVAAAAAAAVYQGVPHRPSSLPALSEESTVENVEPSIRCFAHPFSRGGLYVGVRGSAVRLNSGGCLFYNPISLTATTKSSVDDFCGQQGVRFIVAPSLVHHIYLDSWAEAYPNAQLVGGEDMPSKHSKYKDRFVLEIKEPADAQKTSALWGDDVQLHYLPDYVHKEILAVHKPTDTLFVADMVWNLPATSSYKQVSVSEQEKDAPLQRWVDGMGPHAGFHKALTYAMARGGHLSQESKDTMQSLKPKRIVVQHGQIIDDDATNMLRHAWSWTGTLPQPDQTTTKDSN